MKVRRAVVAVILTGVAALTTACSGAAGSQEPTGHSDSTAPRSTTAETWDRPAGQDRLIAAAGLPLLRTESTTVHFHAHLTVLVDGRSVPVPADLGINTGPGGAAPEHGEPGIAPLHTHDATGVLHVEAPAAEDFTLGQVFTLWGVALGDGRLGAYYDGDRAGREVTAYVDGEAYKGDPAEIVLEPHEEVTVVAAPAGEEVAVPTFYDFPPGE